MTSTDMKVKWCQEKDCHYTTGWRLAETADQLWQRHEAETGHTRVAERRDRNKYATETKP